MLCATTEISDVSFTAQQRSVWLKDNAIFPIL